MKYIYLEAIFVSITIDIYLFLNILIKDDYNFRIGFIGIKYSNQT